MTEIYQESGEQGAQAPTPPEIPKYKPTDDEIGDSCIADWKGRYAYFYSAWHEYGRGVWTPFKRIERLLWEKLKTLKSSGIKPSDHKVGGIEKYLQHYLRVDDDCIDTHTDYINLQNGLFNLRTEKLEKHRRDVYMTSQLPFAYDENAICPAFIKFLTQACAYPDGQHDIDLKHLILEALGYSLTSNTDFRTSFWLLGESGTGKSVLIGVLASLAGDSHVTIDLDELNNSPYQLADVAGKRVVTFTEPRSNSVLADNHYKRLVSQDYITARQIFGKPFRFRPICKVWGAMNELPRVIDRSDAIYNRVKVIPFNYRVPDSQRDPRLAEKLEGELAGIFNLALVGLKRLRRGGFTPCEQVENARAEYKAENDTEAVFIAENCVVDPTAKLSGQALYDAYNTWCKRNGLMPKSATKVARDWLRLGFKREHTRKGNMYLGLMLTTDDSPF